jgi:PAS domain S-box-containing protein
MNNSELLQLLGRSVITSPISQILTDADGNIVWMNTAAEHLYECSAEAMNGQSILVFVPPQARHENERLAYFSVQNARAMNTETQHITQTGRIFAAHVTVVPIYDEDGTLLAVSRFVQDVTAQIQVISTLSRERDLLEAILEASNDAILMIDQSGRIAAVNLQFETVFHVPRYYLVTRAVPDLLAMRETQDLPTNLTNLMLAYGSDTSLSAGGDFEHGDSTLVWYSAPVYTSTGESIGRLFVFRDATYEREVDRMKTEFVALVSHELRTPLTSIRGFTDLILDMGDDVLHPQVKDYVHIVQQNAERLTTLVTNVLDLTRVEAGRVELQRHYYSIQKLVDFAVYSMRQVIEARHQQLSVTIAPNLPELWVDRDRIIQVLSNLLSNASKFTAQSGHIQLRVNTLGGDTANYPVDVSTPAILFSVQDNGMGIPADEQNRIFERFYRAEQATRQQIPGSGLGLALVKALVELHGGKVWFHSIVGQGSQFYFTLPLVENKA